MDEEERLRILKMVQEGKVTVEEAVKLLEALEAPVQESAGRQAKWLRIRVWESGAQKVAVNLPLGLVDWALRLIPRRLLQIETEEGKTQIDPAELARIIRQGVPGKLVEVTDGDDRVEIVIE